MLDIELTKDGDLNITETGGLSLTHSICQAINIRLKWFLGEWNLNTGLGVPYFPLKSNQIVSNQTYIFGKNPNLILIKSIISKQIMSVKGVEQLQTIDIIIDKMTRVATITYVAKTTEGLLESEVPIYG